MKYRRTAAFLSRPLYGKETFLYKHSKRDLAHGIEMSGGSLGQGFPFAVGIAMALLEKKNTVSHVYAIVGDGECNEGSIWEAAALAGHHRLPNLTVIVDKNQLQLDGYTHNILDMSNMEERWRSFGFEACTVDGHNYDALLRTIGEPHSDPFAVIANTIKGNGISFAQDNPDWHDNFLTDTLYQKALEEIENDQCR